MPLTTPSACLLASFLTVAVPMFYLDISWGIPPVSNSPTQRHLLFPAVKTTYCDFPAVNLVSYTKNIRQHHQVHNN